MDSEDESSKEFDPKPNIEVSLEEFEEWCHPWKATLIVKLLGKRIGFRIMDSWIRRIWARKGEIKVLDLNEDFYLVRFLDEGDYNHALYEGP